MAQVEGRYSEGNVGRKEEFAYTADQWHTEMGKGVFLIDGAATSHMVSEHVFLENEQEVEVVVKGLGELRWVGKGKLVIQGISLREDLRVPESKVNLLSEGVMQSRGCKIISQHDWRGMYDGRRLLIEARLERGLFV
jgi:hypothetical protein